MSCRDCYFFFAQNEEIFKKRKYRIRLIFVTKIRRITFCPYRLYRINKVSGRIAEPKKCLPQPIMPPLRRTISVSGLCKPNNPRYLVFMSVGNFTAIVVPFSELSSTRISPLCSATISHTSESPNPTPPFSLLLDLSTRKKG